MSVREHPSEDAASRQERAEQTDILDIREISGEAFDVADEATVYEVDLINEDGDLRENVTIIPRVLFESTKDVQHRHQYGIVGKYSRALAMANDNARAELEAGIRDQREQLSEEIQFLKSKDARLLHTLGDLGAI